MKRKSKQQSSTTIVLGEDSDSFGASLNGRGLMILLAIMMGIGMLSTWVVTTFELHGVRALVVGVLPMFLLMPVVYLVLHAFFKRAP